MRMETYNTTGQLDRLDRFVLLVPLETIGRPVWYTHSRNTPVVTKNNEVCGLESSCILHGVHFLCYDAMQSRDITTL